MSRARPSTPGITEDPAFAESVEDLYDNAPCGYVSTTPDGTLVRANATFLRWSGYTREELLGVRRFQDLLTVGGRIYHETHIAPMLRMHGSVREIAVEVLHADGRRLPALLNSVLKRDAAGEPQLVRTTVLDASDRTRYEQELLAARNRERAARERTEELQRITEALYEQQRDVAHALQRSLLAGAAPEDPRIELATAYQAAEEHLEVGGDWHDAFPLAGDRIAIVIGDVVGRGLNAATAMGQLRSAVRALAAAGHPPAALLGHLDTYVEHVEAARYATLVYAELDPATGACELSAAGHLPPLLIPPNGPPRLFMGGRSTPLGLPEPGRPRAQARLRLAPGAGLLLYTDGLVERRDEAIDAGLTRLRTVVAALGDAAPARLVERLPAALRAPAGGDDDVCIVSLRRRADGYP